MNPTHLPPYRRIDPEALEARLAQRIAARLNEQAARLPPDLSERLRVAREQAVQRARQVRQTAAVPATVLAGRRGAAVLGAPPPWWVRIASVLPLLLLVIGLVLIQQAHQRAEIRAAAEVDAALLTDDLPPSAYGDPGFVAFLTQPEP